MTTPETRSRLRDLEQQLAETTPPPLTGQTAIPLQWRQEPLWEPPRPIAPTPAPAPPPRRRTALPRHIRRHQYDMPARPATRPHGYYLTRKVRTIHPIGSYL